MHGHPGNMVTSLLRPLFLAAQQKWPYLIGISSILLSGTKENWINLLNQFDNITLKPVGYCMKNKPVSQPESNY